MPQPPPYVRVTNYSAPLGATGVSLDADLDAIKVTLDAIEANLKLIQRDDGVLANQSVSPDTITPSLAALMQTWTPRGAWVTQTKYNVDDMVSSGGVNYICMTAHISGVSFDVTKFMPLYTGINAGLINQLAYFAANGSAVSGLATLASALLVTDGSGVPSLATVIPNGVTATTQAAGDNDTSIATTAFAMLTAGKVKLQVFDIGGGASQTYTPSTGMVNALGFTWGGGGGSGGTAASAAGSDSFGAGGGAGSLSIKLMTAAAVGASKPVTLGAAGTAGASGNNAGGAGGDTSIGTLCVGKGGSGGLGSPGTVNNFVAGGLGGVAGTGDIAFTGMPGASGGSVVTTGAAASAAGGSSLIGGGGRGVAVSGAATATGEAGTGRASGGSGGACRNANGPAAGAVGTAGHCFIIEFCNQG
jgi:hypothetical protein